MSFIRNRIGLRGDEVVAMKKQAATGMSRANLARLFRCREDVINKHLDGVPKTEAQVADAAKQEADLAALVAAEEAAVADAAGETPVVETTEEETTEEETTEEETTEESTTSEETETKTEDGSTDLFE